MKTILRSVVAFWFLAAAFPVAAEEPAVLKALLVIEDDYENPELNAISSGTKMDYGLVSQFLDTLNQTGVVKVEKTLIRGQTANKATVEGLVKNMKLSDKDIFFFYFSGHGGMEKKRTFLATSEEGTVWRDELENMVKARPARLKFIVTDACSSSIEAMAPRALPSAKDKSAAQNPYTEIYRHLFMDYKGLLHLTAATEGEYAWSGDTGGLFTKSFFNETLLKDPKLTWEENVKAAQSKTQDKFSLMMNAGLFDKATVADLDNRGIKTQKPEAYVLPILVGGGSTVTAPVAPPTGGTLVMGNLTGQVQDVVVADALSTAKNDFQKFSLKPGAKQNIAVKGKSLLLFFGTKPQGQYFELEPGAFVVDRDDQGKVGVFRDDPSRTGSRLSVLDGQWIWEEYWDIKAIKEFSMEELKPKYVIDMDIRTDGTFVWGEGQRLVRGQWKIADRGDKKLFTLIFNTKGKTYQEVYEVSGYGTPSMELKSKDDPTILVYLSKRNQ